MPFLHILEQHPIFSYSVFCLMMLCIGSFLNVVIYRLPLMLEGKSVNLFFPPSHCPQCQTSIRWYSNIPLLSFLLQQGRCMHCRKNIPCRYPAIELLTALLSIWVLWYFGWTLAGLFAIIFTCALLSLSAIDFDTMMLPDQITLPLVWIGLFANYMDIYTSLESAVLGAMLGYLSLFSVYWIFKFLTGKEGLGYGDFKLLAAIGAFGGWSILPFTIFCSSLLGSVVGLTLMCFNRHESAKPMPFGPYIAVCGWLGLMYHEKINNLYLVWAYGI